MVDLSDFYIDFVYVNVFYILNLEFYLYLVVNIFMFMLFV